MSSKPTPPRAAVPWPEEPASAPIPISGPISQRGMVAAPVSASPEDRALAEALEQAVSHAAVALFRAYGVSVVFRPSVPLAFDVATISVGRTVVGGPHADGALLLAAPFALVASCRPQRRALSPESSGDWLYVRDWTKELANQLLGRIKNRLVAVGLTLESRAPMALTGTAAASELRSQRRAPFGLVTERGGTVLVWLDLVPRPGVTLDLSPRSDAGASEGDVILF